MEPNQFIDPYLTPPDRLVLDTLLQDIDDSLERNQNGPIKSLSRSNPRTIDSGYASAESSEDDQINSDHNSLRHRPGPRSNLTEAAIEEIRVSNDPQDAKFEPTVFMFWDIRNIKVPAIIERILLRPYIQWAREVARNETDVVMITHLFLYSTTTIPSALYLYYNFSWWHGIAHCIMQGYYTGTYTLMKHQHIHMNGILAKPYAALDYLFPFVLDPLFGHTWNSYYFHHVKHHHVEGNGPNDISSTIRYQRDSPLDFAIYVGRFLFFIWVDLPLAFFRTRKWTLAAKAAASEFSTYLLYYVLASRVHFKATLYAFLLPFALLRLGLMIGNWGQHCFVDEVEPDSDYRSSITLIDVASNRFCFNDGYHTSHHLNPRRHWRDHPLAFLKQKSTYAQEHALVFRNIDYLMITFRVLRKDYAYLAKCLVPIGDQIGKSEAELADLLRTKTRKFTEADIHAKFGKQHQ